MATLKEKTAKGLLWGALGSGATQGLNLLFGIVLARLLSPHDYGIVGVLAIFSCIAGNLQNCGFVNGLINLKEPTARDFDAVFWFNVAVSALIYVVLFFEAPLIAWFFHEPELLWLSRFVFLSFFISSMGIAHSALLTKRLMVREKTITGFIALVLSGAAGVWMAFRGMGYWALAWQSLLYISIVNLCRYYFTWHLWRPSLSFDFGPIRQMFPFSVKILITSIVNTINTNVLTFLFGNLFPMRAVGNYTQAMKWNTMAHSTISGTMEQVAQPVLAETSGDGPGERRVFRKMMRFGAFLSFPALFGMALVAHEFILVALGPKWAESAQLMQILCISGAFMPFYILYQNLAIAAGRSDIYMWCNLAQIAVQIGIIVALHGLGMRAMVIAYALSVVLWLGVWQRVARRLAGLRLRETLADVMPFMLAAAAVMGLAWLLTSWIENLYWLLTARIVVAAGLYFLMMKLFRVEMLDECLNFIRKKLKR